LEIVPGTCAAFSRMALLGQADQDPPLVAGIARAGYDAGCLHSFQKGRQGSTVEIEGSGPVGAG